tara:strand:- start:523 stop:1263 length:741 start_codon:yes stop_codon:yes gene_type:complete
MSRYTLPNGLELNGKLYNLIELDEIRGKHQNMMVNPNPKTPIDHIEPLLTDLVKDLTNSDSESALDQVSKKDLILYKLPIQDIQFIMIKVREVSYGKDYIMQLQCTNCETKNNAKLDLSKLEVFPRKDKLSKDEMKLPKEKIEFTYGHMSLSHLLKMAVEEGESEFTKSMLTSLTAFMLTSLGDKSPVQPSDLDELRGSDLDYIRDNMPSLSEIDMEVEHTCTSCNTDFKQELPALAADFLLRTRT